MKTMNAHKLKKLQSCLNFRHSMIVALMSLSFIVAAKADEVKKQSITRKPAAVEEEVLTVPLTDDSIFSNDKIFADDDAGIMKDMKASLFGWEQTEEYAKTWGLERTGMYTTPTTSQKGKYISKKMLRYADKRLAGEMKNAQEGSALHSMKTVEKNLRPSAAVNMSKNFGFKFKARVLQGKAIVEFKNPWLECNTTVSANGKARLISRKEFKEIGLASGAEYSINDSQFLTYIDQQLTDNVKARLSNTSGVDADSRAEISASFPFNL